MTLEEFADVFAVLAIQLRQTDADEATIRAYFEPLKALEIATVRLAAERLSREAEWFPKTSEWLTMVSRIRYERRQALDAVLRRLSMPLCEACRDTGMALGTDNRARRCRCQDQREREVAGIRPLPALPPAEFPEDPASVAMLEQMGAALAERHVMPRVRLVSEGARRSLSIGDLEAHADDPILAAELERRRGPKRVPIQEDR